MDTEIFYDAELLGNIPEMPTFEAFDLDYWPEILDKPNEGKERG